MKKAVSIVLRVLVAVAGIAYIAYSVNWSDSFDADGKAVPGIVPMLKTADWRLVLGGLLVLGFLYPLQAVRWWLLMRVRGLDVPLHRAFNLIMVSAFFSFCMPGMTGGDVARAYYAAKRKDRRADAVTSIVLDRITGLVGLILLGGLVGFASLENAAVKQLMILTWSILGGLLVCGTIYYSGLLHRWKLFSAIGSKIPGRHFIAVLDRSMMAYRNHLGTVSIAVVLAMMGHASIIAGATLAGYGLGIEAPPSIIFAVLPMVLLTGTIPLTYQGLGVMEAVAFPLLSAQGFATENQVVGMLLIMRFYLVFFGMMGSISVIRGNIHLHDAEVGEQEIEEELAHESELFGDDTAVKKVTSH